MGEEEEASLRPEGKQGQRSSEKRENVELFGQLALSGLSDDLVPESRAFLVALRLSGQLYT